MLNYQRVNPIINQVVIIFKKPFMVKLGMMYYWVAQFTSKQSMNLLSTGVSLDPSVFGSAEPYPNQFYSWLSVLLEKKQKI